MINDEVLEVLKEFRISQDNGICYLISLFYGFEPTYVPDDLKLKMNVTGIYTIEGKSIKWNIPLFQGQQTAFDWVKTEYCPMFKAVNPTRDLSPADTIKRMKALFAKMPEVRKEDVLGATRMYLSNTDPRYIMTPYYFILKGKGIEKTETILGWLEKYKENKEKEQEIDGRNDITNTMQ